MLRAGRNLGFAGGVVRGLEAAAGEWVLLVNDDAELEPGAVDALLATGRATSRAGTVTGQVRFHARRDVDQHRGARRRPPGRRLRPPGGRAGA